MQYSRPAWVEINLNSIKSNLNSIKKFITPKTQIMAIVKANAYGHGAVEISKTAIEAGVSRLGVALAEELIELRSANINAPIHILGNTPKDAAQLIVQYDGISSIYDFETAVALNDEAKRQNKKTIIHIKVDTGMNRLGIKPENTVKLIKEIRSLANTDIEGIFSHFSSADDPNSNYSKYQLNKFNQAMNALEQEGICPPIKHIANSAATMLIPESHFDMVRIGISMYGLYPSKLAKYPIELEPALSLYARISRIENVAPPEGVSYGITFKPSKPTKVATIPIGYSDGYFRQLSNIAEVIIKGRKCKVAGVITMDQLMAELPDDLNVKNGEKATLIGKENNIEITADDLAHKIGTINYEIVCALSKRLPRKFIS